MATPKANPGNHPQQSLADGCQPVSPLQEPRNIDPVPDHCDPQPSQKEVDTSPDLSWLKDASGQRSGIGQSGLCDPMQTGQIVEDILNPTRSTVYRYSKSIRGADEAMRDLFNNIVVLDDDGKAHPVPIVFGPQERAVAAILQDNVRKDNSLVVDRLKLPMLAIHQSDLQFNQDRYTYHRAVDYLRNHREDNKPGFTSKERYERDTIFGVTRGIPVNISYTLYCWTSYLEDVDQILEQIITKFSPVAYIRVRGVYWETIVTLDSIANNLEVEPGDQKVRVIKYQFNLTAQTYIPQPIIRKKAVLKTQVGVFNETNSDEINKVLGRLEQAVKELEE